MEAKPNAYDLNDFLSACAKRPQNVFWGKEVRSDALKYFKLNSTEQILSFLISDKILSWKYINTEKFRIPGPNFARLIDAYEIKTITIVGYVAFFKAITEAWQLKSFHDQRKKQVCIDTDKIKQILHAANLSMKDFKNTQEQKK